MRSGQACSWLYYETREWTRSTQGSSRRAHSQWVRRGRWPPWWASRSPEWRWAARPASGWASSRGSSAGRALRSVCWWALPPAMDGGLLSPFSLRPGGSAVLTTWCCQLLHFYKCHFLSLFHYSFAQLFQKNHYKIMIFYYIFPLDFDENLTPTIETKYMYLLALK